MSISSMVISITDTYNPDAGVGTAFNDKLRTIRRLAMTGWRRLLAEFLV